MKRSPNILTNVKPYISKRVKRSKETVKITGDETHLKANILEKDLSEFKPVTFHRVVTKTVDTTEDHSNVISALQWHPRNKDLLASSSFDKTIIVWNAKQRKLNNIKTLSCHAGAIKDLKWMKNGNQLISASYDKTVNFLDVDTGSTLCSYKHLDGVTSVIFHASDDNVFLSGTNSSGVYAWDVRKSEYIRKYSTHFGQIQDLLFLPDEKTFLSSAEVIKRNSLDKTIIAWDFQTSAIVSNQIYQEPYTCSQLKLHPDRSRFYAQSAAGYIVIFDVTSPWKMNKFKRCEGHQVGGYHIGFEFTNDGKKIYSGDSNGCLYVYDTNSTTLRQKIDVHDSIPCVKVACNQYDTSLVVCGAWDGRITLLG